MANIAILLKTMSVNTYFILEMQIFINLLNVCAVGFSREVYNLCIPRSALHYYKRRVSLITVIEIVTLLQIYSRTFFCFCFTRQASNNTDRSTSLLPTDRRFIKECSSPWRNHFDKCP